MKSFTSAAGAAGRLAGVAYGHTSRIARLIDWQFALATAWHCLIALLVLTYCAGEATGSWLHRLNDRLARLWVRLWVPQPAPSKSVTVTVTAPKQPAPPAIWPLFDDALALHSLPVSKIRPIAGIRSKSHRKSALIAYCLAA